MEKYQFAVAMVLLGPSDAYHEVHLSFSSGKEETYSWKKVCKTLMVETVSPAYIYHSQLSLYLEFLSNHLGWEIITIEQDINVPKGSVVWMLYLRKKR